MISRDQLEQLAAAVPDRPSPSRRGSKGTFDLEGWLTEHGDALKVVRSGPWSGGQKWVLNPCPFDGTHVNESAFIVRFANGAIAAGCHHNGCSDKNWAALRALVEPFGIEREDGAAGRRGPSQADLLVDCAAEADLFHAVGGDTAFATVVVDSHFETWPVRSKGFRRWLVKRFFDAEGKPPAAQALADTLGLIEARAQFEGVAQAVALRVAGDDTTTYLDLADDGWRAVEITRDGWRVVTKLPVKFRRAHGMLPLPLPERSGSLEELRPFINIGNDEQWVLFVAALAEALRPSGPYPILEFNGEPGSAKSTAGKVMKRLVDPNNAPLRAEPRDVRDLMIAATNNRILAYDNLSYLPPWLSDALCRLATGGGFSTRELYTDADEIIFDAQRPVILNGIEEIGTRTDFTDRALRLALPVILDAKRRSEAEFWVSFDAARPRILGALLDVLSRALRCLPDVRLEAPPRMADFAFFGTAVEHALGWEHGRFLQAYKGNRDDAHTVAIDASPVGKPLTAVVGARGGVWTGTSDELLQALRKRVDADTKSSPSWPKSPRALSGALRRLAPSLRATGWQVVLPEKKTRESGTGRRLITLRQAGATVTNVTLQEAQEGESVPSGLPLATSAPVKTASGLEKML